ncbi:MAG: enoyl-CoA hydratase [Deltaproteobacteria bacterium]|nr:enoyl-CoA hydratase [Deltaproteobacteria bacterium]
MDESVLLIEKSEGIATLTLNRPQAMNALSTELRSHLKQAFEELRSDPGIGVVILTGNGRAFCGGLDLKELSTDGIIPIGTPECEHGDFFAKMREFDRPIIGAVNGIAVTGGLEVALSCDLLIASSEARFADTHARVGLLPGRGLSQKLARLIGVARAKEMSFTGNFLTAEQALNWGLVNRVTSPEELMPTCRALAKDMLSCVPKIVRGYKRLIDRGYATTLSEGLELEERTAIEQYKEITPEWIESRVRQVKERGRKQSKK